MRKTVILFVFYSAFATAQTSSFFKSVESDFFIGKNIEHDKSLNNAIQGNAYGFLLFLNTKNKKETTFNQLYNAPKRGFSFLYLNYNSTVLGEVMGAYRHYTYNLTPKHKNPLQLTTGFGLGYANSNYHDVNNNQNFALGSKLLVSAFVKLQYYQYLLNKNLTLNSGLSLIHFSNIAFKNPNLGINTVALNLGVTYSINPVENVLQEKNKTHLLIDTSIKYNLILRGGYNESLYVDSGLYPFYTLTFYGSKYLNNYSTLTTGIDYFHSKFLKNYIKDEEILDGKDYNENDFNRIGFFIGHELTQNNFAFISQIGYTFYYPFPYVSRIYERFGFKYNLSNHFFSEVTLKANLFRAEALELGIGYKF